MINEQLSLTILNMFKKKDTINDWLSYKYKVKPLAIYGYPGTGKTTLANYILKDWIKVYIRSDLCKSSIHFDDYLNDSLYKKSITMMFNNKVYKALIIDDISYIQENDKKLFKSILNFSKKKNNNHPIIYIFNSIHHKNIKQILKLCYPFKIEYDIHQLTYIIKNFLIDTKNIDDEQIKSLIIKSNYNLHNIIVNIDFYKYKYKGVNLYDKDYIELSSRIRDIIDSNNISDIYIKSQLDYNIIGLNILDNSYNWIKPNKELTIKEKLILLNEIYNLNIISDYFIYNIHENNEWSFINHIITFNIFIPIILLRNNNIKPINIDYNKYISKCIIYIHNSKLLTYSKVNTSILSTLYAIIEGYYKGLVSKTIVINYINYYNIPLIISEKFLKYFSDINKNKVKIFY